MALAVRPQFLRSLVCKLSLKTPGNIVSYMLHGVYYFQVGPTGPFSTLTFHPSSLSPLSVPHHSEAAVEEARRRWQATERQRSSPSSLLPRRQAWIGGHRGRRRFGGEGGLTQIGEDDGIGASPLPSLLHLFSCGPKAAILANNREQKLAPCSWRGSELCLGGGESLSWLYKGE